MIIFMSIYSCPVCEKVYLGSSSFAGVVQSLEAFVFAVRALLWGFCLRQNGDERFGQFKLCSDSK